MKDELIRFRIGVLLAVRKSVFGRTKKGNKMFRALFVLVAVIVSSVGAQAATITKPGETASFSLLGNFTYIPPINEGDDISLETIVSDIVAPTSEFTGLSASSVNVLTALPISLLFGEGFDNSGPLVSVAYDRDNIPAASLANPAGSQEGVFEFAVTSTDLAVLSTSGSLLALTMVLTGTLSDLAGFYDDTPVEYVFAATTHIDSSGGTWSLTIHTESAAAPIPIPATLPLLLLGLGGLGLVTTRLGRA